MPDRTLPPRGFVAEALAGSSGFDSHPRRSSRERRSQSHIHGDDCRRVSVHAWQHCARAPPPPTAAAPTRVSSALNPVVRQPQTNAGPRHRSERAPALKNAQRHATTPPACKPRARPRSSAQLPTRIESHRVPLDLPQPDSHQVRMGPASPRVPGTTDIVAGSRDITDQRTWLDAANHHLHTAPSNRKDKTNQVGSHA